MGFAIELFWQLQISRSSTWQPTGGYTAVRCAGAGSGVSWRTLELGAGLRRGFVGLALR